MLRIDVVGGPEIVGDRTTVTVSQLGGRRAQVVLTALALARGPVSSVRLAEYLWGEQPPATWPTALRGVIAGLRIALATAGADPRHPILTEVGGYRLGSEVDTDVAAAERSLVEAAELARQARPRAALDRVARLVEWSGDDLLAGGEDTWLDPYRQRLDDIAAQALEILVGVATAADDTGAAVRAARAAVARRPLAEHAHRLLISALTAAGDRAEAVQAYERCRAVLAEQLAVDPSPETVAVYLAALQDDTADRSGRIPRHTTSFVGRGHDLTVLLDELASPGLCTLTGLGGVGKSRLAAEAALAFTHETADRCWVDLGGVTDEALVLAVVSLGLGWAPGTDDLLVLLADRLAARGRFVLVLDAAENVRDAVAGLVVALRDRCPQARLLVTSRLSLGVPGERVHVVAPLPVPTEDRLAGSALAHLIADRVRAAGGRPVPEDQVHDLWALLHRTAGLPLAAELIAAQLAMTAPGDLVDQLATAPSAIEEPVRGMLATTYNWLDADTAATFRHLAVVRGQVGLSWLGRAVADPRLSPAGLLRCLRTLEECGLVQVDRSGPRWRYSQADDVRRFARRLLASEEEEHQAYEQLAAAIHSLLPDDPTAPPATHADAVTEVLGSIRSLFTAGLEGHADRTACIELAFRLHRYWASTNFAEGRFWLSRLLGVGEIATAADSEPTAPQEAGLSPGQSWHGLAMFALGYLDYWADAGAAAAQELRAAADSLGTGPFRARALIYLAGLLDDLDQGTEAVATVMEAIDAAEGLWTGAAGRRDDGPGLRARRAWRSRRRLVGGRRHRHRPQLRISGATHHGAAYRGDGVLAGGCLRTGPGVRR